ncbi:MAG TPA: DUF2927 domain-containing protein [Propylenella sp.]
MIRNGLIMPKVFAAIAMRPALLSLTAALLLVVSAGPGRAFSDAELADAFERTVFGSEYPSWGWQSRLVKKFTETVRFYVDDRSAARRGGEVLAFVRSLPGLIDGLRVAVAAGPEAANFRVFVVDRADYNSVVTSDVYGRPSSSFAPGKCLVRVVSSMSGISRADAVVVADEGEFLFRRCMTEEVLQGLGPVNDDASLAASMFNDNSRASAFTRLDRFILNMLYHPLVQPGMTKAEMSRVMPAVIRDVRARLE